jgi:hypothetical protein
MYTHITIAAFTVLETHLDQAPPQGSAPSSASSYTCRGPSEKDAKLAQKLGQLQPFPALFPRECMANLHILGQPNTFLARRTHIPSQLPKVYIDLNVESGAGRTSTYALLIRAPLNLGGSNRLHGDLRTERRQSSTSARHASWIFCFCLLLLCLGALCSLIILRVGWRVG